MKIRFNPRKSSVRIFYYLLVSGLFFSLVSCSLEDHNPQAPGTVTPVGAKPAWAPDIDNEMWAVVEQLLSYGDKPIPTLTPQQARMNHTVKDAVMDLVAKFNIAVPAPQVDTAGKDIPVTGGSIHARVYTPKTGSAPFPVIVYYHGGGWVIANIDVYDASASALAEQTGAIVVSVGYRKGPERKFPTAHNDAFQAYQWVMNNAATFRGDTTKIGVAGESAGGNLAANVSIMARDSNVSLPVHELLVYPIANSDTTSASYTKYAAAKPLDKPSMQWFFRNYLNTISEVTNPKISIVNADLSGLPSTTIILAEIDPLQSEGSLLAERMKAAGVEVTSRLYTGVTHEFFGAAAVVPDAKDAQAFAAAEFKKAFNK
ncbi:alpha/beta hydrolase [Dyadobacter flavalbus]|uniref:Alpha/beta hydrolase n=1 Tax=Dyadobacter flavalbus TaxID=2579942 RepID=A0A5M8QQT7_9BACT|nr:alpha/beta hydrolase [Dyadobacter flavalbus]KAA6436996.1 alpha/beta hydrolase [Dyadobacter flavalbus]